MTTELDVTTLREAAQREIDGGLPACQVAVARSGEVIWTEGFGEATAGSRFLVMSATKPIVASAAWILLGEGALELERRVVDYIPEFGTHGKDVITVEQVLLMIAGFPTAAMSPADGADPERRRARFAEWELEYEPGTQYAYHATSAHWVIADLIERVSGMDFRDYVERRVTTPLGLPRVLGIARSEQGDVVGNDRDEAAESLIGDRGAFIEAGVPGGGGVMTAATLAVFYQGLLHNPGGIWKPDVLIDGTTNIRTTLPDPMMNLPANRTIGVVIGAGFGSMWDGSATAFGWPGAGGQVGFAEPATGISFAFLQHGDTDQLNVFARARGLSAQALTLR